MKFDPTTLSVNPAPPCSLLLGEIAATVGVGFGAGGGVPPPEPPPQAANPALLPRMSVMSAFRMRVRISISK